MPVVDSIQRVRFGLHSNVADFTSTPGTLTVIECRSADNLVPRGRKPLARNLYAADGARYLAAAGVQDIDPFTIDMDFRGVNSNTGGASTWQNKMEQARMLDSIFGTAASATSGAATTMTNYSGTTVTVADGTNIATGEIILLETDEGAEIRQVTAGGTTTSLTINAALQGTFTDDSTVLRLPQWAVDTSVTTMIPGYFEAEWVDAADVRRAFLGCTPESLELDFPIGGLVGMKSVWHPDSWADAAAADPTYAAPTCGSPIVVADARLLIGGTEFLVEEAKLMVRNRLRFRDVTTGVNGRMGAVVTNKHEVAFTCRGFWGDNANSIGEFRDDAGTPSMDALFEETTTAGAIKTAREVTFQVGTTAGSCMFIRIPVAEVEAKSVKDNGVLMAELTIIPTRPSSGSKSLYLAVG